MALLIYHSFVLSILFVVIITITWCTVLTTVASLVGEEGRIEEFLNDNNSTWWQIIDTSPSSKPGQLLYIQPVNLDEGHIHSCYQYKVFTQRMLLISFYFHIVDYLHF